MKFTFRRDAHGGHGALPVIAEIPDIRLAQLEGKNGIGKTLAARLLEIVSGQQPFAALPKAWASLVDLLGQVEIHIEGAPEGTIVAFIDSANWVGMTQAECAANPGTVTIAGEPTDWERVRRLIQVRRIAGDEGLAETLGRTLREQSITAGAEARRLVPIVAEWSDQLDALVDVATVPSPSAMNELRNASTLATKKFETAQSAARKAAETSTAIANRSARAAQALAALRTIPLLLEAYEGQLRRHEEARSRINELETQLTKAGAAQVYNAQRQADIRLWTRRLDIRRTAFIRARLQERQLLTFLGLETRPSPEELVDLQNSAAEELDNVEARLRTVDLATTIRNVGTDIESSLQQIPSAGMTESIAELDRPVSAGELLIGIRARREVLKDVPRPGEAVTLDRQLGQVRGQLLRLRELPQYIDATERKRSNVADAEAKLAALLALTPDQRSARETVEAELASQREILVAASTEAMRTLAAIQAFGAVRITSNELDTAAEAFLDTEGDDNAVLDDVGYEATEEALETAVSDILRPAQEVADEISDWFNDIVGPLASTEMGALKERSIKWGDHAANIETLSTLIQAIADTALVAESQLQNAARKRDELESLRDDARNALRMQRLRIASAITNLTDPSGQWADFAPTANVALAAADLTENSLALTPEGFLGLGLSESEQANLEDSVSVVLQRMSVTARAIEDAASELRDAWGTVSAYLGRETQRLAPRLADEAGWSLAGMDRTDESILKSWTEAAISSILSAEALRSQLFDGSDQVTFDLDHLAVSWRDPEGRRRRRPLEAFSSGEQVFAYTRAKLETFRSIRDSTDYVVIFLDEFGAFVARDRFGELLRYVQEEALGVIADQVIVMLPLSTTDLNQALALRALRPADEQQAHIGEGYFAVSAEPERVS